MKITHKKILKGNSLRAPIKLAVVGESLRITITTQLAIKVNTQRPGI